MARLDEHLVALEEQVTARGGTVHWARDANEANAIVTRLVQATGADEVVKVKSMATQEIGLNEALEAAGITAHETDLAELIVQLGEDKPSHILVPAIHKNRAEIREIFLRTMPGVDPGITDDPRQLAMAARAHLRERFLRARVAISGANFAVAETGTLAVVESEGNGRMCLTLPETLITVMGIEKVVPTWRDLEVFLQLLPRSSTGERMNPYTSLWAGVTPGDGPQEFHLVLLDNGRTAVLADEVGREALHCIRCSACLNVCPVYERTGGHAYGSVYPGPIGAVLSPQLTGVEDNASLPYASSLCGACYDVCPVAIDIPSILVHLRAEHVEAQTRATPGGARLPRAVERHVEPEAVAAGAARRRARPVPRPREADPAQRPAATGLEVDPHPRPAHPAAGDVHRPVAPGARLMSAREEVLGRIRTALGDRTAVPDAVRDYRLTDGRAAGDPGLLDLLVDRLEDYKATVVRCGPDEVAATVAAALDRRHPGDVVVAPGLPAGLAPGRRGRGRRPASGRTRRVRRHRHGGLRGDRRHRHPGPRRLPAVGAPGAVAAARRVGLRGRSRAGGRQRAGGARPSRPDRAADDDQRPVGDQRHRAAAGGGRARPAHADRRPGGPTVTTDDTDAVLDAEDRRYRAMIDADLATLDRLLDDRVSYAHSSGVRDTKAEYLEKVRNGYYVYRRIDHPVDRVEVVGDTAIVVGRMTADLTVDGTPKVIDNLALAVWTRTAGDWRLLAYAPTRLPD